MPRTERDNGFTLVELMVVVLIIGILVAIAVPAFNLSLAEARKRSCFANQRTVEGAYCAYVASVGPTAPSFSDFASLMGELVPVYLHRVPECPAGGSYSWQTAGELNCGVAGHFHY